MKNDSPIAIMDSGLGGLTVLKAIIEMSPNRDYIYFSDNKNSPYGSKTDDELLQLCTSAVDSFIKMGCEMIILACNTATTATIHVLREQYPEIEFVGVEPALKPAAELSTTKNIGVLATERTLKTLKFKNTKETHAKHVEVHTQAGYQLVELIEDNKIHSNEMKLLLQTYLLPMVTNKVDYIVLGCTHYSFIKNIAEEIVGKQIKIIDTCHSVAKRVKHLLQSKVELKKETSQTNSLEFISSGNIEILKHVVEHELELRNHDMKFKEQKI